MKGSKCWLALAIVFVCVLNLRADGNSDKCDDATNPCQNGGTCKTATGVCDCGEKVSGVLCDVVDCAGLFPKCVATGGSCEYDAVAKEQVCKCGDGKVFHPQTNQCENKCDDATNPCQNGGKCNTATGVCDCEEKVSGVLCDVVDCKGLFPKCETTGGSCEYNTVSKGQVCKCQDGNVLQSNTEECKGLCDSNPCKNGGTCSVEGGNVKCSCVSPYTGNRCERDICIETCGENYKNNGVSCKAIEGATSVTCECEDNDKKFDNSIKQCRETCQKEEDCEHKAGCVGTGDIKFCSCKDGTSGDRCQNVDNCEKICGDLIDKDCTFNTSISKVQCDCHEKETKKFDERWRECRVPCKVGEKSCENGATCKVGFCECLKGTRGDTCSIVTACVENPDACGDAEAVCKYDIPNKEATCECNEKDKLFDMDYVVCRKVCTQDTECTNGEKCWKTVKNKKTCACEDGKEGDGCTVISECKNKLGPICEKEDADCVYDAGAVKKATCKCRKEKHTYDPANEACRPSCSKDDDCKDVTNMVCDPAEKACKCKSGYEGADCSVITGCKALKEDCENAGGECIFNDKVTSKASCKCKDDNLVYDNKKCVAKFCSPNPCQKDKSDCVYDEAAKAGMCKCKEDKQYYDYSTGTCKSVGDELCLLRKNPCGKGEKCEKGNCTCADNFESDAEKNGCKPKACNKKDCFPDAECSNEDGILKCYCPEGKYFDGIKCADGKCFLGDKTKCSGCNDKVKEVEGKCVPTKEGMTLCNEDCGFGYCLKEEGKDGFTCECYKGIATNQDNSNKNKCVLTAGVCATRKLTDDKMKCHCSSSEKYTQAKDGITCVVKTCEEESVQQSCGAKQKKTCSMSWKGSTLGQVGYNCKCIDSYVTDAENKICTEPCSKDANVKQCLDQGKLCYSTKQKNIECKCPPSMKDPATGTKDCSQKDENAYLIRNIPVMKRKYELREGGIDEIALKADLFLSMKTMFRANDFEYANLHDYKFEGDVVHCSVWVQAKNNITDQLGRVLKQFPSVECPNCDENLSLLPPSTSVNKKLLEKVEARSLSFCSAEVKNSLCGEHAACDDKSNKCSCPPGFRTLPFTIRDSAAYRIQRCEDINECETGTHECPRNTSCVNTPGSYYCTCKPNYKKKDASLLEPEKKDKEDCYDLCTPNPCGTNGECVLNNGTFDCKCTLGFEGTFCSRSDVNLAAAKKSTKVVGAVLGVILGLTLIAFFVFYWKVKRNSQSEDFELAPRQDHASEMMERRPVRGVINKAYE